MYRSTSVNRIWDGHLSYHHHHYHHYLKDIEELPTYDPSSNAAKKEKTLARFAGNVVHVIPFVLLFCAFLLWFFSTPIDVDLDGNFLVGKLQRHGNTIEVDLNSDGTGTFPLELGDLNPLELAQSRIPIIGSKRSK